MSVPLGYFNGIVSGWIGRCIAIGIATWLRGLHCCKVDSNDGKGCDGWLTCHIDHIPYYRKKALL